MFRLSNLRSDESGQTFVEWLGLMAFIVVLVGVMIAAAPGIGHKITDVINSALDALPV
jgi:Flp pilus assembly pilin Flp